MVREPLAATLAALRRRPVCEVHDLLVRCERGPSLDDWNPPSWLLPHQVTAARRLAACLGAFGGALLADAVGMGKTYVALAVASRYRRVACVVPATLVSQWDRVSESVRQPVAILSQESLSRGGRIPTSDLVIVDEAHRLRNVETQRYDRCVRTLGNAHLLLLTATPVVNGVRDLLNLLRLFLPDHALAFLGLPTLDYRDDPALPRRLARAVARLTVARPIEVLAGSGITLPAIRDGKVIRVPTADPRTFRMLECALDELTFPGVAVGARHLLRAHVWHRLASSVAALRQTLRRHLAYTDRALTVVEGGPAARRSVRRILGSGDDLQLELAGFLAEAPGPPAAVGDLVAERGRLLSLLCQLPLRIGSPKSRRLVTLLDARPRRAIVFCSSAATAHELAHVLGWKRLAVVAGGKARIASGPVAVETALDWFAPSARRSRRVADDNLRIDLLIATDLVSEGLDLQDADTVVHYDLPWTPVRVAQRIGRIARLGSPHAATDVLWFAPPPSIERRLQLERRLARKVALQLLSAVPNTSAPGRARMVNSTLAAREFLCSFATSTTAATSPTGAPAFALVRGPSALAAGVQWLTQNGSVDELLVVAGSPPRLIDLHDGGTDLLAHMRHAPPVAGRLAPELRKALWAAIRGRLRAAAWPEPTPTARQLRRDVLALGHAAGRRRDVRQLTALNEVLDRLQAGQRLGAVRTLASVLAAGGSLDALEAWLTLYPAGGERSPGVRLIAVLAGDGTHPIPTGDQRTRTWRSR